MWKPIILDVECIVCNKSLQKINHDPGDVCLKMGKITNRRSRTPNWSVEEKQFLLELIKERKDVVVNKTTNGPNHYEEKDVAWNEILRELTARFGNKFSGSSIKKVKTQWQNMKRIAREEITLNGPEVDKYSKQSLEVCHILDLVKNGVLKSDDSSTHNLNDTTITTNVEIKTERIDEEQPGCSGSSSMDIEMDQPLSTLRRAPDNITATETTYTQSIDSPTSSVSEQMDESFEQQEESPIPAVKTKNVSANTDPIIYDDVMDLNPFHTKMEDLMKFTSAEKHLRLESLKEERHVMRAMRETAELNKIIAEQRLKHILWVNKREMAMYPTSGEPGAGAGKGGGGGGAIREAGGGFGKMEAAREEEYFYRQQKEQLKNLKTHLDKEIAFHEEQIKRHEDAIRRHKEKIGGIDQ